MEPTFRRVFSGSRTAMLAGTLVCGSVRSLMNLRLLLAASLSLLSLVSCLEDPAVQGPGQDTPSTASEASPDLDTTSAAITLTCNATFDCRTYPPPKRTDGRSWLFYGSRYCSADGAIYCEFVPSGLSSNFPTIMAHTVPSACRSCTSNDAMTSTCSTTNYDISSWSWVCH